MAFAATGFRGRIHPLGAVGNGSNSVRFLHGFVTADTAATVEGTGYFNTIYEQLSAGDVIMAVMAIGGTIKFKNYVVASITSGVVALAVQTVALEE